MVNKKTLVIILSILLLPKVITSGQVADSLETSREKPGKIFVNSFLAPAILIAAGAATMYDRGWYSSYDAYECIQKNYPNFHTNLDDYLVFLPAVGVYGLNWAGVKGKHNFLDRSMIYLVSVSLAAATNGIIKASTDVLRPNGSDYNSFPSNHTALAFVSATFLHMEYKDQSIWYGIAGYSIATTTGMLRMLNNEHWMSDVLVGAGIGILSSKLSYLLYPWVKDRLGSRRRQGGASNLSFFPYASPNQYGIFLHYQIH